MANLSTLVLGWAGVGDQSKPGTKPVPKPQTGIPTTKPGFGGRPIGFGIPLFGGIPDTMEVPMTPEQIERLMKAAKKTADQIAAKKALEEKQTKCKKCEAFNLGKKHTKRIVFGDPNNGKYQLKISNKLSDPLTFKAGPATISDGKKKASTPIEEWILSGVSFDGLWPIPCTLVEAKGNYAQFLDPKKPDVIRNSVFNKQLVDEARSQKMVSLRYKTTKLLWYFLEDAAKKYFDNASGNLVTTIHETL